MKHKQLFIGGNWKMNGSLELVNTISASLNSIQDEDGLLSSRIRVVVCPPAPLLLHVKQQFPNWIHLGSQTVSTKSGEGAYTGEISSAMLKSMEVEWVIIGHSERRQYFNEDEAVIKSKIKACLDVNINVIYCIGESLEIRESGKTYEYLDDQLSSIMSVDLSKIVIAYEPIWAIGTGVVATSQQIQEAFIHIKNWISDRFGQSVPVIYGGSVNAKNFIELLNIPELDGFLIGGASITKDFSSIVSYSLTQIQ